jgi:hypothetical protein
MSTPLSSRHHQLLAAHGLKATYIEARDESVDSEIQLSYATGLPTGYSVQLGLYGCYYVNQHGGEGAGFWMKMCGGEFRDLMTALKYAAQLVAPEMKGATR